MSKARSMYAGSSGSNYGVNKNSPGNGNGKWQGLPPITNMRSLMIPYVNTRARGDNRNVVFCMNQLGGVGKISTMFATTADGVKDCNINEVHSTHCSNRFIMDNNTIRTAVNMWLNDPISAKAKYGPIDCWNTSNVTDMSSLFYQATSFNDNISNWDVSNVTNMYSMFAGATLFNQPIGSWNTGKVTTMGLMFYQASNFNQPVGDWDVSKVIDRGGMFLQASNFNQPIRSWKTGEVTAMTGMFREATSFNQPVGDWDVGNVIDMVGMFQQASNFNQPIGSWNIEKVNNMSQMFLKAITFNQDLTNWNRFTGSLNPPAMNNMFEGATAMKPSFKPKGAA